LVFFGGSAASCFIASLLSAVRLIQVLPDTAILKDLSVGQKGNPWV
jgi:hypothetical protein